MKIAKSNLLIFITGFLMLSFSLLFSAEFKLITLSRSTIQKISNLKKDETYNYNNKDWIVIANDELEEKGFTGRIVKLTEKSYGWFAALRKNVLIFKIKMASHGWEASVYEGAELTFAGKALLGALTVGGGAYLALAFAPVYINQLYEKASPWLDSLRSQFQSALDRFKTSQAK